MEERKYFIVDVASGQFVSNETKDIEKPLLTNKQEEYLEVGGSQISLKKFYLYALNDSLYVSKESETCGEYILTDNKKEALFFSENEIELAWKVALDVAWEQLGQFYVCGE